MPKATSWAQQQWPGRVIQQMGDVMQIDITRFGNLVVFDEQNHPVELGSLWQDQPAVIVFVRHFG